MIYGFWLDSFSAFAFGVSIAIPIGIWIGVAHGAQIERLVARFRPEPKVTPEMAQGVLFELQHRAIAKTCRLPVMTRNGLDSIILPPLRDGRTQIDE